MVMTLFSDTDNISGDCFLIRDSGLDSGSAQTSSVSRDRRMSEGPHIIEEKLTIPQIGSILGRPRLDKIIERSLSQFAATLISGRSGTGKTALVAEFARRQKRVAWFSVESPEIDWLQFSTYFAASFQRALGLEQTFPPANKDRNEISATSLEDFLTWVFEMYSSRKKKEPVLIVLDDLHHIFDAPWFGPFFNLLIHSLPNEINLLLLCRSRPPSPLWRLRSKQMLNVIDEKLLAFSGEETKRFFKREGLPEKLAQKAQDDSFGRIAKVKLIAKKVRTTGGI